MLIDGTYIPLFNHPNWRLILTLSDFFNCKKFYPIVLLVVYDANKLFQSVCACQHGGVYNVLFYKNQLCKFDYAISSLLNRKLRISY
jgi:hypothetical protein